MIRAGADRVRVVSAVAADARVRAYAVLTGAAATAPGVRARTAVTVEIDGRTRRRLSKRR